MSNPNSKVLSLAFKKSLGSSMIFVHIGKDLQLLELYLTVPKIILSIKLRTTVIQYLVRLTDSKMSHNFIDGGIDKITE